MDGGAWGGYCDFGTGRAGATNGMSLWQKVKTQNRKAKMVCIDIQPNTHTQFKEREDILNVGGFSDTVFDVINMFVNVGSDWVGEINKIAL
jgi:60 kDa SS-A/Ro ribonucleoprotein